MQMPISTEVYENLEIDIEKEVDIDFMNDLITKFAEHEICEKDRANQKKTQIRTFIKFVNEKNLISLIEKHSQKLKLTTIHQGLNKNYLAEDSTLSPSTKRSHFGSLNNFIEFLRTERNYENENPLEKELVIKDILKLLSSIRNKNKNFMQIQKTKKWLTPKKSLLTLIIVRNIRRSKELKTFSIKEFSKGQMKEGRYMFRASEQQSCILLKKRTKLLVTLLLTSERKYAQKTVVAQFLPKNPKKVVVRIYLTII